MKVNISKKDRVELYLNIQESDRLKNILKYNTPSKEDREFCRKLADLMPGLKDSIEEFKKDMVLLHVPTGNKYKLLKQFRDSDTLKMGWLYESLNESKNFPAGTIWSRLESEFYNFRPVE